MTEESRLVAGRYRLLERLGTGAMGVVWKAEDQRLQRVVAVKEVLLQDVPGHERQGDEARKRVLREGRNAARLLHPHATAVFDVVEDDGQPWLIMEYLPSTSLRTAVDQRGPLPVDEVATIGSQVASALAAAHSSGLVHRDVKPANVLLTEDDGAKLTDFGISRAAGDGTLTASGIVAGTPAYLAPEVARGEDADFRSDVFSLGATLYHAVEGSPPFGMGDNQIALLHRVARGQWRPPENAGALTPVLLRLLEHEPERRPTMAQSAEQLRAVAAGDDAVPPVPAEPAAPEPPASEPRKEGGGRRGAIAVLLAVLVVLLAVGTGIALLTSGGGGKEDPAAQSAAPGTSATRASSSEDTTTRPPPSTTSAQPTTTTATPEPGQGPAAAVRGYYALLPGQLEAGYASLSEGFKSSRGISFADYQSFWSDFSAVDVSNVRAQGENTVAATVTYVSPDGATQTEQHVYTLVNSGGRLLIDSQTSG